jgi:hypothetical protein
MHGYRAPKKPRWVESPACMNFSTVLSKAEEHHTTWYLRVLTMSYGCYRQFLFHEDFC